MVPPDWSCPGRLAPQDHSIKIVSSPLGTSLGVLVSLSKDGRYVPPDTLAMAKPSFIANCANFHTRNFHSLFNYFSS